MVEAVKKTWAYLLFSMKDSGSKREVKGTYMKDNGGYKDYTLQGRRCHL